jgi:hypothetical protein
LKVQLKATLSVVLAWLSKIVTQRSVSTKVSFHTRQRGSTEAHLRVRGIIERDVREKEIRETVAACQFTKQLQIHIDIRGMFGWLSFLQSWHCRVWFLEPHKTQIFKRSEGISLRHS